MSSHLTEDQICRAIAGQSTLGEQRHLGHCAECRAEVDRSWNVITAFRRAVLSQAEREIRRTVPSLEEAPSSGRKWEWGIAATVVAAMIAIGLWRAQQVPGQLPPRVATAPAGTGAAADSVSVVTSEFLPLAYSTVPLTEGRLVRLEVPGSALTAFGLHPAGAVPAAVLADVVVGEDGLARAVRFVFPLTDGSIQREKTP